MSPSIRKAVPADARALAELAELTFRDTFAAANTSQDMDLHCRTHYGEAIQAQEISTVDRLTLVCDHEGQLIGFAQLAWGAAPDGVGGQRPGEIHRLYVDRPWHGKGVAQALIGACLQAMDAHGSDVVWLGVWEHNPRAIAFYRKWGFAEAGEHVFTVGTDPQRDLIMARPVAG
jgi:ribosomal protein S18 acetylase RimI-like enzyme